MSWTAQEIASQPDCWQQALDRLPALAPLLPRPGESVAVVGCGTSWFMAQSYAALREQAGHGRTDAFAASEAPELGSPTGRRYDRVLALTRSGTTTEVLELLESVRGRTATTATTAITADPATPVADLADDLVVLDFADEQSVVQTRFPTTQLVLLRAHLGEDLGAVLADGAAAAAAPVADVLLDAEQISFLGRGWTYGLAREAALKVRETSAWWTESYPAMEYRHGPISVARPGRVVWSLGDLPDGLPEQIAATGAHLERRTLDPVAELVRVQRLGVALAARLGRDVDSPQHLSRSVVLPSATVQQ
ncbi:SIS domain-containing protein [Streptacidiphilus sp. PB12-B1b]|uniref:SIS domain-containing protein n=1 Tax=Streptacidiphilus sp. PB12-B1b TaxID=2705012 RepID=UPI001CDD0D08|nr:SIS domain-containing protein [Streptacidiphilus sp. PB12-B1b]